MNDILDVSRYIVNYSNEKKYSISNLKLQKLLYYVQAYFLYKKKEPCYKAKIEAWKFGPVVPEAYEEFKKYGASEIPKINNYYEITENNNEIVVECIGYKTDINQEDEKRIKEVVDDFSSYSAAKIIRLSHNQKPWIDAYKKGVKSEITLEAISDYFK